MPDKAEALKDCPYRLPATTPEELLKADRPIDELLNFTPAAENSFRCKLLSDATSIAGVVASSVVVSSPFCADCIQNSKKDNLENVHKAFVKEHNLNLCSNAVQHIEQLAASWAVKNEKIKKNYEARIGTLKARKIGMEKAQALDNKLSELETQMNNSSNVKILKSKIEEIGKKHACLFEAARKMENLEAVQNLILAKVKDGKLALDVAELYSATALPKEVL